MEGRIPLYITASQTALCHKFPEKRCLTTAYSHLQVHFGSSRLGSLPKKKRVYFNSGTFIFFIKTIQTLDAVQHCSCSEELTMKYSQHLGNYTFTRIPFHYLPQRIRNDYFSRDFHRTLVHNTVTDLTAPGRMCFTAVKYYTCPTRKIVPESLNMKSSTS